MPNTQTDRTPARPTDPQWHAGYEEAIADADPTARAARLRAWATEATAEAESTCIRRGHRTAARAEARDARTYAEGAEAAAAEAEAAGREAATEAGADIG